MHHGEEARLTAAVATVGRMRFWVGLCVSERRARTAAKATRHLPLQAQRYERRGGSHHCGYTERSHTLTTNLAVVRSRFMKSRATVATLPDLR